jgi:hypothetical protein
MIATVTKNLIISEFDEFLDRSEIGYMDDYSNIIRKIHFLESLKDLKNTQSIFEYLKNE